MFGHDTLVALEWTKIQAIKWILKSHNADKNESWVCVECASKPCMDNPWHAHQTCFGICVVNYLLYSFSFPHFWIFRWIVWWSISVENYMFSIDLQEYKMWLYFCCSCLCMTGFLKSWSAVLLRAKTIFDETFKCIGMPRMCVCACMRAHAHFFYIYMCKLIFVK